MYKISKRLGHSSIEMTMDRYGHLMPKDEDEILNAINDNF
jgi:integrase